MSASLENLRKQRDQKFIQALLLGARVIIERKGFIADAWKVSISDSMTVEDENGNPLSKAKLHVAYPELDESIALKIVATIGDMHFVLLYVISKECWGETLMLDFLSRGIAKGFCKQYVKRNKPANGWRISNGVYTPPKKLTAA